MYLMRLNKLNTDYSILNSFRKLVYLRIHEMYVIVLIHDIKRCDHIWRIIWHHHWYEARLLNNQLGKVIFNKLFSNLPLLLLLLLLLLMRSID